MDPFSGEGELINILTAFYQSQYTTVIEFDTSAFSDESKTAASILKLRARIASGDAASVLKESDSSPEATAVKALAQSSLPGQTSSALSAAEELAENYPENATVQVCCGTVLAANKKYDEALNLLNKHQGNLEAVALIVQIHLIQNRTDLALKEVQAAKRWAQDNLVINLAEAWVGLRVGGEKYQSTFYVYEELASAPSTSSTTALIGQAVSEIHLGRLPEAEAALQQVLASAEADPEAIANSIVLASLQGNKLSETEALIERLKTADSEHALLKDLEEKSSLFDEAKTKYAAKVA